MQGSGRKWLCLEQQGATTPMTWIDCLSPRKSCPWLALLWSVSRLTLHVGSAGYLGQ